MYSKCITEYGCFAYCLPVSQAHYLQKYDPTQAEPDEDLVADYSVHTGDMQWRDEDRQHSDGIRDYVTCCRWPLCIAV